MISDHMLCSFHYKLIWERIYFHLSDLGFLGVSDSEDESILDNCSPFIVYLFSPLLELPLEIPCPPFSPPHLFLISHLLLNNSFSYILRSLIHPLAV